MRIYLFDVDGTLLRGEGAGKRALQAAFDDAFGRPDAFDRVVFAGATDRAIVRQALGVIGVRATEAAIDEVLAHYLTLLPAAVAESGYRAECGVLDALEAVGGQADAALGLGTGNVEMGARIKLGAAGLNHYFGFGGFGSDAEDRAELLEVGARRGAAALGVARHACEVRVIGDSVRDVSAAHAIGAFCLAVATGGTDAGALRAAGADIVFDRLAAPGALEALIG